MRRSILLAVLSSFWLLTGPDSVWAGTFTYQGQLKQDGGPFDGLANLEFRLFDVDAGGAALGTQTLMNVDVVVGLFTVQLNGTDEFGPDAFNGEPRWLEIAVNGTTLSPRQEITPAPLALHAARPWESNGGDLSYVDGNVGVGTTTPAEMLSVAGTVQSTTGGFRFPDGTVQTSAATGGAGFWTPSGANIFNNNTGNVGIGRPSPAFKLDTNSGNGLGARIGMEAAGCGALVVACNPGDNRVWLEGYNSTDDGSATEMLITGFAGGTLPQLTLNVANTTAQGFLTLEAGGDAALMTGTGAVELNRYLSLFNSLGYTSASGLKAGGVLVSDSYFYANPGKNDLIVKGVVGIGTATPSAPMTIQTSDSPFVDGVGWSHTDGTRDLASIVNSSGGWLGTRSNHPLNFYTNNSAPQLTLSTTGQLGIGTTTPGFPLTIRTSDSPFVSGYGWVHTDGTREIGSYVSSSGGWLGTRSAHPLYFFTADSSPHVTLTTAGNLGVGTTNPVAKLDVNGTTRTTVLEIVGADLAEKFPTSDSRCEPGMVMEIDPVHTGKLRIAREAYSPRVAGVVSGAGDFPAGAVLGHLPGNEDAPPIALSGRVYVNCEAGSAAIGPGDLLTTSTIPGHAMKAVDRARSHGAVIGKAMTSLKQGERGLVLVLVNLQ